MVTCCRAHELLGWSPVFRGGCRVGRSDGRLLDVDLDRRIDRGLKVLLKVIIYTHPPTKRTCPDPF